MKIPDKAKERLEKQGYWSNCVFYEEFGETEQTGTVGNISGEHTTIGGVRLRQGDRWRETLDTKQWTIKVKKI
jgi:hypothetical protein